MSQLVDTGLWQVYYHPVLPDLVHAYTSTRNLTTKIMNAKSAEGNGRYGISWSREETLLALDLYCRIPFSKTKANNPVVIELANLLSRTPASVARKLGNLGAFDPTLRKLNITGLTHTSNLDREIWDEFYSNWNQLAWDAVQLRQKLTSAEVPSILKIPLGPSEVIRPVKQRVHQSFFREAVLSSHDMTCCVTGITVRECLVASHIVPWSVDERFRADPTNGLCLSATFDRLFDSGMMTVLDNFHIRLSPQVTRNNSTVNRRLLACFEDKPIRMPSRFTPAREYLQWHFKNRFRK